MLYGIIRFLRLSPADDDTKGKRDRRPPRKHTERDLDRVDQDRPLALPPPETPPSAGGAGQPHTAVSAAEKR